MCKFLGDWWRCMIHFARRLAALALTYGIKLMDVQEKCEVYLMWHFTLTDYIDNKNISSIEHARKLLEEIEAKKTNAQSRVPHLGESTHFSKRVSNEELTAIYDGLIGEKMLCDNPTLADFIYWHTGDGTRPAEPLMWKTKNVCRYYVQQYLDSNWPIAEQCFLCKKGSINNLWSASHITKDNMEIIDKILKNARLKSTKNTTKTD